MKRVLKYTVKTDYVGKNIKTFLKSHYKMSSALITDLKKVDDGICVNGEHKNVTYILQTDDVITINIYEMCVNEITPNDVEFKILYEDEDIMAVDKPPFVPTHPSAANYENTLANGIIKYWNSRGESRVFRAVNRLDKNTSGIVIIAKNAYAHARLCDALHTDEFRRKYIAITEGEIENDGLVDKPIAREKDSIIKRCVRDDGQRAVTHYKVLKKYKGYTMLEIELETGRTHQIRVHMSYIGHPLVCDFLYGSEMNQGMMRQALHSSYVSFIHPVGGQRVTVECDIEKDMSEFIRNLN